VPEKDGEDELDGSTEKIEIRTLEVPKCCAGEGWRRWIGRIDWEDMKYYIEARGEEFPIYDEKFEG